MLFKKIILLFLVLLTLNFNLYAAENINDYDYLKIEINNKISFEVDKDDKSKINSFKVISYFYPQNIEEAQAINSFETSHSNYGIQNNADIETIVFDFNENEIFSQNEIENTFIIQSLVHRPEVSSKTSFPIKNIDEEYKQFLKFGEYIDTNSKIKAQATQLAEGEDDVFIVASKIAKWIREDIDYDLSTLTANPNQASTEVFESKQGVCREISHLYISMLRSLGIPARVVTGHAYTNSEELVNYLNSNWGGHAWAEVLIGDEWVPFDLTYNQYGFVDASHIVVDRSAFLRSTSVEINASGYNFDLVKGSLNVENNFEVIDKKDNIFDPGYNIRVSGSNNLAPTSFGYVQVEVENEKDFYQVIFLQLAKVKDIELIDSDMKMIILKPNQKKVVFFRYEIPQLDKGYIYTFPFTIYNEFVKETFDLKVKEGNEILSKAELPQDVEDKPTFTSNEIEFDCSIKISSPNNVLNCNVKNTNNFQINDLTICVENGCKDIDLTINEEKTISFTVSKETQEVYYIYDSSRETFTVEADLPELTVNMKKISTK